MKCYLYVILCYLFRSKLSARVPLQPKYFHNKFSNISVMLGARQNKSKSHEEFVTFVFRKSLNIRLVIPVISMAYAQNCSLLDPTKTVMIFDGCFRTQLSTKDTAPKIQKPDRRIQMNRSKKNAELVKDIHLDFLKAGANVIRTNTYWASESYIKKKKKVRHSVEYCNAIIEGGVKRAQEAVETFTKDNEQHSEKKYFILGSCGSATNTYNININESTRDEIKDFHLLRVQRLVKAGVDAIAFENIETAEEANAIIELMRDFRNSKVWISFRIARGPYNTLMVDDILKAVKYCCDYLPSQIIAIGINCVDPECVKYYLSKLIENRNVQNLIPIAVYPSLHPSLRARKEGFNFAKKYPVLEWQGMGASYIGGCCHMLPKDIENISCEINPN